MSFAINSLRPSRSSVRARLAFIQALSLAAIAVTSFVAWTAITAEFGAAHELARVSEALHLHQDADMMHDALRADVNAALLVPFNEPETSERVRLEVLASARRYRADIASLRERPLRPELAAQVATTGVLAENFIAAAVQIATVAKVDRSEASRLEGPFRDSFEALLKVNDETTQLLAAELNAVERGASEAAIHGSRLVAWSGISTALVVCFVVGLIAGSIRKSLGRVSETARALAGGDLSVRSEVGSHDEVGELAVAINKMADDLQEKMDRLQAEAKRDAFGSQLVEALENSDTERAVRAVAAHAMALITPTSPIELLLSDSSRAHLERAARHPSAGAPGCGVESPFSCTAVRRGNPIVFPDSEALNACPRLRERADGQISAVCVPLSFMGRSIGVLHASATVAQPYSAEQVSQLSVLGLQVGARIGTVRAFERTQLQARTDSLTGLGNRRAAEELVRTLTRSGEPYAFVLADLDRFKQLNDQYGHETGDRALRLFSQVLKETARPQSVMTRWGGEEFGVVLPGASATEAAAVAEGIRTRLAEALLLSGSVVPFTSSFGVADSTMASQFDQILRIADDALYRAKDAGRDRVVLGDPRRAPPPAPRREAEQDATVNVRMLANED